MVKFDIVVSVEKTKSSVELANEDGVLLPQLEDMGSSIFITTVRSKIPRTRIPSMTLAATTRRTITVCRGSLSVIGSL